MASLELLCGTVGKPRLFGKRIKTESGTCASVCGLVTKQSCSFSNGFLRAERWSQKFSSTVYESPGTSGEFLLCVETAALTLTGTESTSRSLAGERFIGEGRALWWLTVMCPR